MRILALTPVLLLLGTGVVRGEQMIGAPPGSGGLMCRDEKSLADLTGPHGEPKVDFGNPNTPAFREYGAHCKAVNGGEEVTVVTRRRQTTIVTYKGETWYVPNIDFMTPRPDCLRPAAQVTFTGTVEQAFQGTDEADPKKGFHYARLALDKPVCFLGNQAVLEDRYVSLVGTSSAAYQALMGMAGRHVTVSGIVDSPDNGNQPPDNMMMFDPRVKPGP